MEYYIPHREFNSYLQGYTKIIGIFDTFSEFRIFLSLSESNKNVILIHFSDLLMLRYSDESYRILLGYEQQGLSIENTLYTVANSEFINWFLIENGGKYKIEEVIHYCIVDANMIIDLITYREAEVSIQKRKLKDELDRLSIDYLK
jgi:hypothetical protein